MSTMQACYTTHYRVPIIRFSNLLPAGLSNSEGHIEVDAAHNRFSVPQLTSTNCCFSFVAKGRTGRSLLPNQQG